MDVVGYCMFFRGLISIFVLDTLKFPSGCILISSGYVAPLAPLCLHAWLEDTRLLECYVVSLGKYYVVYDVSQDHSVQSSRASNSRRIPVNCIWPVIKYSLSFIFHQMLLICLTSSLFVPMLECTTCI